MARRAGNLLFRILTWLGALFVAAGFIALAYEAYVAVGAGGWRMIPAGQIWFELHNPSLNLAQAVVQRYLHPFLWDPLIAGFLQWPLWASLGGFGAALMIVFGRRRR